MAQGPVVQEKLSVFPLCPCIQRSRPFHAVYLRDPPGRRNLLFDHLNGVLLPGTNERRPDPESFSGTRKLIRPQLSAVERRRDPSHGGDPLTHALVGDSHAQASSHAEAFYFQKQIQQQTDITVVLDDGEELHGVVEWYDRCAIKMRSGRKRILIYKTGIKYLYKTSDTHTASAVMK